MSHFGLGEKNIGPTVNFLALPPEKGGRVPKN